MLEARLRLDRQASIARVLCIRYGIVKMEELARMKLRLLSVAMTVKQRVIQMEVRSKAE